MIIIEIMNFTALISLHDEDKPKNLFFQSNLFKILKIILFLYWTMMVEKGNWLVYCTNDHCLLLFGDDVNDFIFALYQTYVY